MKDMDTVTFGVIAMAVTAVVLVVMWVDVFRQVQANLEAAQPAQVQPVNDETTNDRGMRIDPLGRFTSPGRCVGSICF